MKPLYKTTLTVWSEFDPQQHSDLQLLQTVQFGGAFRSRRTTEHLANPAGDPDLTSKQEAEIENYPTETSMFETTSGRNAFLDARFSERASEESGVYRVRHGFLVLSLLSVIFIKLPEGSD